MSGKFLRTTFASISGCFHYKILNGVSTNRVTHKLERSALSVVNALCDPWGPGSIWCGHWVASLWATGISRQCIVTRWQNPQRRLLEQRAKRDALQRECIGAGLWQTHQITESRERVDQLTAAPPKSE